MYQAKFDLAAFFGFIGISILFSQEIIVKTLEGIWKDLKIKALKKLDKKLHKKSIRTLKSFI